MKVEQLKAELVVFKGLMSNVSSAFLPLPLRDPRVLGRSWPFSVSVPPSLPLPILLGLCSFSRQVLALLQRRWLSLPIEAISESRVLSALAGSHCIPALGRRSPSDQKDEGFKSSTNYVSKLKWELHSPGASCLGFCVNPAAC